MRRILIGLLIALTLLWGRNDIANYIQFQHTAASIVMLTKLDGRGGGTGFELQYGNDSYTVTNSHVCELGRKDGYLYASGKGYIQAKLKILAESETTDLCLLSPIPILPKLQLRGHEFKKGDRVSTWGHPSLRPLEVSRGTVTIDNYKIDVNLGWITNKEEANNCKHLKNKIEPILFGLLLACMEHVRAQHITAQIEPGSSGSPVLGDDGKVGGVVFAGMINNKTGRAEGEIIPSASLYLFLLGYTGHHVGLE